MRYRWNGSIQSGNTPTYDKTRNRDFQMYRCMVIKVYYVDDHDNITKNSQNPEVLYDCVIIGGFQSGGLISNCRLSNRLSGNSNYSTRTLTPASKDLSKTPLSKNDGDIVYIQFVQGHSAYPVITALGTGISDKKSGTKRSQGPRDIDEFNGLIREINNKGEFNFTQYLGKTTDGVFKALDEANYKLQWLENEVVKETFKSGLTITKDGKNDSVVISTKGGVTTTIDGKGNKASVKAGSTEIIIDGASGKITLKGQFVDLGAQVTDMVTKFTELSTAFQSHFHLAPQAPSGTLPTGTPTAPLLSTVGSKSVKVQD